jgi:hypothetical protein
MTGWFGSTEIFLQPRQEMIMFKRNIAAFAGTLIFTAGVALAADQDQDRTRLQDQDQTKDQIQDQTKDRIQDRTQDQDRDRIYGSQLMTQQERNEYRNRMRSAKTAEERQQIREEHHERMKVRAKERGVTIPNDPPMKQGGGMGSGAGMGSGGGQR